MNPLDTSELLEIELMNPNPTSSKTKNGPVYRVSFEVQRDAWDCFMAAETAGMVLEGMIRVTARNEGPPGARAAAACNERDGGDAGRPKGGPISKAAAMLCEDEQANLFAVRQGYLDFKHMIYVTCDIQSRAELDHNEQAAEIYERIKSQFIQWAY